MTEVEKKIENIQVEENKNMENNQSEEENSEKEAFELETQISELKNQVEDLKDKLLRKAAEFENYKKRNEEEKIRIIQLQSANIFKSILSIVDDIENALSFNNVGSLETFKKGIEITVNKFVKLLEIYDVRQFNSIGEKYDVNFHDVISTIEDETKDEHTVVIEVQKGYKFGDETLRHSKVIVVENKKSK